MTGLPLKWIALRDWLSEQGHLFGPADAAAQPNPALPLQQGTVLIEFHHEPTKSPKNIVRYSRRDPSPAVLTLRLDPDGTLALLRRQGARDALYALSLPQLLSGEGAQVQYGWDLPRNTGFLVVTLPFRGITRIIELPGALPLEHRDIAGLAGAAFQGGPGLERIAIAEGLAPVGPMPALPGNGFVPTPGGPVRLDALTPGMRIIAADGEPAEVTWAGHVHLPAGGLNAPCLLRAPYFGLNGDLIVSAGAVMRLKGAEVEYLFGRPDVSVVVRDLVDDIRILPVSAMHELANPMVQPFHQVLLNRRVPIVLSGAVFETLDTSALRTNPVLWKWSVMNALEPAVLPQAGAVRPPILRDYEALSLRQMRAA